ncbi:M20/M25/M40 family metallo-hydrolase [uncultured Roseobacter sp.]|uniref:M20 family metallopeptidase n=1 Tax=uncultured Roseobacter sp. TaxID=114847 RepID=UPI0026275DE7|nr:M20/M25/M40 family metallo-hydrolase [uncultured Roseobacter sp.]
MNVDGALSTRIAAALDRPAALALLREAVGIESITGNEAAFAESLRGHMAARGFQTDSAEFLPGRLNVWGQRKGKGHGPHLLITGHTDTVRVDGWREKWAGTEREDPFGGAEVDGAIWARGVTDLKGGICTTIAALDILQSAGIELAGDLSLAFIGDEESGEEGTGISAGIDHYSQMIADGDIPKPDFAVYVEPTELAIYAAQIGFFIADVTIIGRSAYFGRPEMAVDALKATHAILAKVWEHEAALRARLHHPMTGPSELLVTGIKAGGLIAVPGACSFSVIGSLQPGEDLHARTEAFEAAVRSAVVEDDIAIDITYPAGRDQPRGGSATETDPGLPAIRQLQSAIQHFDPERGNISGAPYWSESPYLIERLGIPAVYCAAGDIACCHTIEEHLNIEEYLTAICAFALFMASYCGVADQDEITKEET